jgi:hypothetical protein
MQKALAPLAMVGSIRQRQIRSHKLHQLHSRKTCSPGHRQGRAPLARRDPGHATWAVASRELCQSKTDASEKPVAESNLSLRVPAHVAAQGAIVSGCVHG